MKRKSGMVPGAASNKDPKVRLMRTAKTQVNYRYGMGGLPKGVGHAPKPITLPPMPWDKPR
jgi:hypothetical protein